MFEVPKSSNLEDKQKRRNTSFIVIPVMKKAAMNDCCVWSIIAENCSQAYMEGFPETGSLFFSRDSSTSIYSLPG